MKRKYLAYQDNYLFLFAYELYLNNHNHDQFGIDMKEKLKNHQLYHFVKVPLFYNHQKFSFKFVQKWYKSHINQLEFLHFLENYKNHYFELLCYPLFHIFNKISLKQPSLPTIFFSIVLFAKFSYLRKFKKLLSHVTSENFIIGNPVIFSFVSCERKW